MPAAYIIGAPKCGTTALAQYLSDHPDICVSQPKEPGFFATDLPGLSIVADHQSYEALFARPPSVLRIDASIWYLYSQTAIDNILAVRPDARFIVMLRNPLKMVISLHRQLLNSLDEDETDFIMAWRRCSVRADGGGIPPRCRAPATLLYDRVAAFGEQLQRLLDRVPRERVLVLFQEEMQRDGAAVYCRTLDFLGVGDDGRQSFEPVNEAAAFRFGGLQRLVMRNTVLAAAARPLKNALGIEDLGFRRLVDNVNRRSPEKTAPPPAIEAEIADCYRADMRALAELLGRDLRAEFDWPV